MATRSSATLLAACALLAAASCALVYFFFGRASDPSRGGAAPRTEDPAPTAGDELAPAVPPSGTPDALRVPLDDAVVGEPPRGASELEPVLPSGIAGRLRLDGVPVEGGRLLLRSRDGAWQRSAAIDFEGRFGIGGVPSKGIELSFELPPREERQLLLPRVEVTTVELDWELNDVNLRTFGYLPPIRADDVPGPSWQDLVLHVGPL